jgi:hypothetical protein
MLFNQALSRSRDSEFYVGDLLYIKVRVPANVGQVMVSAHAEYFGQGQWQTMPTSNSALGQAYLSGRYPGVRDYVTIESSGAILEKNVALFIPYAACALNPDTAFHMRYVIRLWDGNNTEIANLPLQSMPVNVSVEREHLLISAIRAVACSAIPSGDQAAGAPAPVPQSEPAGAVQFFDAATGLFVCPPSGRKPAPGNPAPAPAPAFTPNPAPASFPSRGLNGKNVS